MFPIQFFQEKYEYESILSNLQQLQQNPTKVDQCIKEKSSNIDEIIAIFLIKIAEVLKPQYFSDISFFLCIYLKLLKEEKNKEKEMREITITDFMGKSGFNYYNLLNQVSFEIQKRNLNFFGGNINILFHLRNICYHLRNWIFRCKFTEIEPEYL